MWEKRAVLSNIKPSFLFQARALTSKCYNAWLFMPLLDSPDRNTLVPNMDNSIRQ